MLDVPIALFFILTGPALMLGIFIGIILHDHFTKEH